MDRISVRSFRALDVAEHGIRELAKSRLDTTREVEFQALGSRFGEAREGRLRIIDLLREDAFHAPEGYFAKLTLRVEPSLADRLSAIEPRAVEARVAEATRAALLRELPGRQGVYFARFEPSVRGDLEPVAQVHLSCRQTDGGPAPAITREDVARLQARWTHGVERAFGLTRELTRATGHEHAPERGAVAPDAAHLRQAWARAWARLLATYTERLAGRTTDKEFAAAALQARIAREAWVRQVARPIGFHDVARGRVFDEIHVRIEGGNRYFVPPLEAQRRQVLEVAASRAAGLPDGTDRQFAVVAWPAGPDVHAAVYLNHREQAERSPDSLDPARVRDDLQARLREEIRRHAPTLDPTAETRAQELGRILAIVPQPDPNRERGIARQERVYEPEERPRGGAILIEIDREHPRRLEATAAARQPDDKDVFERLQPERHDWTNERVFAVRLRVSTGAEQIETMGLSPEEIARVIERAVHRTYPFLEREGVRNNFVYAAHGRALDVRIVVPEKLGWRPDQLRSPQFQQRFIAGFHQALAQIGPTRIGRERAPMLSGFGRGIEALQRVPQLLRQLEQDPERGAKDVARAVFDKLSAAMPKPFRVMRELSRTVGRFARGE